MTGALFDGCLSLDATCQDPKVLVSPGGLPANKGFLLFADENRVPVQLLIAANIRRTAKARLWPEESETPSKRADIGRIVRRVYYRSCYNDFNTTFMCLRTAKTLFSDSWREIIKLPRPVFVSCDAKSEWPYFNVTEKVDLTGSVHNFGPYPSRKAAVEFVHILQQSFALCQRPDLIGAGNKYQTCPYLQMHICPAPCAGKMTRAEYLVQIENALDAAAGNVTKYIEDIGRGMEELASKMLFEEAEAAKGRLAAIEGLTRSIFRWTGDMEKLAVLHIDRSEKVPAKDKRKKIQTFSAFLITAGGIYRFEDFDVDSTVKMCSALPGALLAGQVDCPEDELTGKERIGLLCSFLYRSGRQGIWLDVSKPEQTPSPEHLAITMKDTFSLD